MGSMLTPVASPTASAAAATASRAARSVRRTSLGPTYGTGSKPRTSQAKRTEWSEAS